MSGIAVVCDPLGRTEEVDTLLLRMSQALQPTHQKGTIERYNGSVFGIGRCKSALINQISQPAWNETATVCAFFHGELFGYEALKQSMERKGHRFSDNSYAEFVVHLYEDKGDAFVYELNGSFALALWDECQQRLIIANDRYGLCPLYAATLDGKYLWGSSPKVMLADASFSRQVNLAAMADFLCLGIPQSNDTMFEGINELPPASLVIYQDGNICCRQYWDLSWPEEETGISVNNYLDGLIPLLKQAAERRQKDQLSAGLLLSGGFDSRVVLSLVEKDRLKAFTFGIPFCDDVQFARQVAKVANSSHAVLEIVPNYLETFAWIGIKRTPDLINCDQFHGISIYDEVASQVNALITGSVAEDIFGHFTRDPGSEFWSTGFSSDRYYDSKQIMTDEELKQLMRPVYYQQMKGLARSRFRTDLEKYSSKHITHKIDYWSVRQQQRRLYNRLSCLFPDNLQFRPLFFDKDVIDFVQTIPHSLRWGKYSLYKQIILRTAPELVNIPVTTTYGLSMNATYKQMMERKQLKKTLKRWYGRANRLSKGLIPPRKKTRFYVDYDGWLRQELRQWAESILLDTKTLNREYWNGSAITQLLDRHLRMRSDAKVARQITALISFELWHRMYLDGVDFK